MYHLQPPFITLNVSLTATIYHFECITYSYHLSLWMYHLQPPFITLNVSLTATIYHFERITYSHHLSLW